MSKPDDSNRLPHKGRLEWVRVSEVKIEDEAQREKINFAFVNKLVNEGVDPDKLGFPLLSKRADGTYRVIDGMHRIEALKEAGFGDSLVQCEVIVDLTLEQEAAMFLSRNNRLAVGIFDKFRIRLTKGDLVACDIDRIVRAQGLRIARSGEDGSVSAVAALEKVYHKDYRALVRTLKIERAAFGTHRQVFDAKLIEGIGNVCYRFNGDLNDDELISRLQKGGTNSLLGKATVIKKVTGRSMADCVAAAVVETYNVGRKQKLPSWWKS